MIAEGIRQLRQSAVAEVDRLNAVIAGLDQLLAMAPAAPVFGTASPVPPVAPEPTAPATRAPVPPPVADTPPGKSPPPAKVEPASGAVAKPREGTARDRIARLLADRGPMRQAEIKKAIPDMPVQTVVSSLSLRTIFEKVDPAVLTSPFRLTAAGMTLYSGTQPQPTAPPTPPPAAADDDPTSPAAIARAQVKAIAQALARSPKPLKEAAAIADLADLPENVVQRRLMSSGPQAPTSAALFAKTESGHWVLTAKGRALAETA